ncbi:MAG: AbrB/MazE/SpoVT family DNA-binding domain-containing protein [Deltaproteobacteria bacterium]|nr:MAG: AbrB/MazE/SpoVT family DNA-binding domain-containing protein [Deltaproteobacteria bacterium]TMA75085.1 MAG: AbrB/MazE/SpoVT family DNA-binding domain-containing protein [Deltaproteobacteria bacterium]TMB37543.1 MAG: AbrB/MazE/SpoVT family DNA-binding domain-containing protein [Deltaproteobacteria bacterium]
MRKKLVRTGNSLALVLDKELLDELGIEADTLLELSTDGDVMVVSPVRPRRVDERLKKVMARAHERYGGVFRKLAE